MIEVVGREVLGVERGNGDPTVGREHARELREDAAGRSTRCATSHSTAPLEPTFPEQELLGAGDLDVDATRPRARPSPASSTPHTRLPRSARAAATRPVPRTRRRARASPTKISLADRRPKSSHQFASAGRSSSYVAASAPKRVLPPALSSGFSPAITRRWAPPSPLPRLRASAAAECGPQLGARDREGRQQHRKQH